METLYTRCGHCTHVDTVHMLWTLGTKVHVVDMHMEDTLRMLPTLRTCCRHRVDADTAHTLWTLCSWCGHCRQLHCQNALSEREPTAYLLFDLLSAHSTASRKWCG